MKPRKQVSKRRWKARLKAGKWVPKMVVLLLFTEKDLSQVLEQHPIETDFYRELVRRKCCEVLSESTGG